MNHNACKMWSSTQGDEKRLQSYERKIYGPLYNNDLESFQRRTNENLQ